MTLVLVGGRIARGASTAGTDLVLPWQAYTILPLAMLAVLGIVSVGIAAAQRQLPVTELLRTGADG